MRAAGRIRFGFAGRGLWAELDARRAGAAMKGIVPIEPFLAAEIKFFGRYKARLIRDGVLLRIEHEEPATIPATVRAWGCDDDRVLAAFDGEQELLVAALAVRSRLSGIL